MGRTVDVISDTWAVHICSYVVVTTNIKKASGILFSSTSGITIALSLIDNDWR